LIALKKVLPPRKAVTTLRFNSVSSEPVPRFMRAAAFLGGGRVEIQNRSVPEPGQGEVLVRVTACALCGTDREGFERGSSVVPGHEIAGTVKAQGAGTSLPPEGTDGVVYLVKFCGECFACRAGSTNMCLNRHGMYGLTAPGGFSEYVSVRGDCFLPTEPSIAPARATTLLDLFGTTRHALLRSGSQLPVSLCVVGCGPIGMGAIAVGLAAGVQRVYASDVSPYRLELAARLGATTIDASEHDTVEQLLDLEADGCEVVMEAAGLPQTQRQAIAIAAPGGRVMIVAHSRGALHLNSSTDLIRREISVAGSEYFPLGEFAQTHTMLSDGRLDPDAILTHRFPLDRLQQACDEFFAGTTGKVVVHP
jgi:threonine 3-dehydrogenase